MRSEMEHVMRRSTRSTSGNSCMYQSQPIDQFGLARTIHSAGFFDPDIFAWYKADSHDPLLSVSHVVSKRKRSCPVNGPPSDSHLPQSHGRQLEEQLFGCYGWFDPANPPPRIEFNPAIVEAFANQPSHWDINNPHVQFRWARELLYRVRDHIPPHMRPADVRMYLGIGRALDWHYGVDAFFLWHQDAKEFFLQDMGFATFDVTAKRPAAKPPLAEHEQGKPDWSVIDFQFYRDDLYGNWEETCRRIAEKVLMRRKGLRKAFVRHFDPRNPSHTDPG